MVKSQLNPGKIYLFIFLAPFSSVRFPACFPLHEVCTQINDPIARPRARTPSPTKWQGKALDTVAPAWPRVCPGPEALLSLRFTAVQTGNLLVPGPISTAGPDYGTSFCHLLVFRAETCRPSSERGWSVLVPGAQCDLSGAELACLNRGTTCLLPSLL